MFRFAVLLLALTSWGNVVVAQQCWDSSALQRTLVVKYGEVEVYSAVTNKGWLMQIFVNPKTGTWTEVLSYPNGTSCVYRTGDGWKGPMIVGEKYRAKAS